MHHSLRARHVYCTDITRTEINSYYYLMIVYREAVNRSQLTYATGTAAKIAYKFVR